MGSLAYHLEQMQRLGYGVNYGRYQMDHLSGPVPVKKTAPEQEIPAEKPHQCRFCGKDFEPQNPSARYCSDRCRMDGINMRYRERQRKNGVSDEAECLHCGKVFRRKHNSTKYCSKACKDRAWYLRRRAMHANKEG